MAKDSGAMKQRLEVQPAPVGAPGLVGAPTGVHVVETAPGPVTPWDRVKAYYHTVFALLSAIAVIVVEFGPGLVKETWIPEGDRHWITLAIVLANLIVTRVKSNEVWAPAPSVSPDAAV
jgi:hypothetical protein